MRRSAITGRSEPHEVSTILDRLRRRWDVFRHNTMLMAGFADGEAAFVGPRIAQIDPVGWCNNSCIACWCFSPLLPPGLRDRYAGRKQLPGWMLFGLLRRLADCGTREIYLSGGGEPCLHPQLPLLIGTARRLGMEVTLNTNFTLVDRELADTFVRLGLERLRVSVWAGDAELYSRLHPGRRATDFDRIASVLRYLLSRRGEAGAPRVLLHNVLFSENAAAAERMIGFAAEVGADAVSFATVDTVAGGTEHLALTEETAEQALSGIERGVERFGEQVEIHEPSLLRSRLAAKNKGARDAELVDAVPCFSGWGFVRIDPEGNVLPCLKAHRLPLGNLYRQGFAEIWNGERAREFRRASAARPKRDPLLEKVGNGPMGEGLVGCHRACDQVETNMLFEEKRGRMSRLRVGLGRWWAAR